MKAHDHPGIRGKTRQLLQMEKDGEALGGGGPSIVLRGQRIWATQLSLLSEPLFPYSQNWDNTDHIGMWCDLNTLI